MPLLLEPINKLLAHCSLSCLFRLAKFFSVLIAHSKNQISKQTKNNINLCFFEKNEVQKKQLYRESIVHTVCSLVEMAALWHQPMQKVLAQINNESICADFKTDLGAKIIVVPHFGSWELMNLWLAQQGVLFSLYKPARSTQLDAYILRKRSRNGAILVPTNLTGLRSLLKGLKVGATVMILPDQKPGKDGAKINAKFYGYDASTSLLIKSLNKKVNCSVYIAAAIRDLKDASYQVHINKLNDVILASDDQQSADYLNQSIEQFIAIDEAQYQWSYRRFSKQTYLDFSDNTNT